MMYFVTDRFGAMTKNAPIDHLKAVLAELDIEADASPHVYLESELDWCLTAYSSGTLVWQHIDGKPRHMRAIPRSKVLELWLKLARGENEVIESEPWHEGDYRDQRPQPDDNVEWTPNTNSCLFFLHDPERTFTTVQLRECLEARGLIVSGATEPLVVRSDNSSGPTLNVLIRRGRHVEAVVRGLVGNRLWFQGIDTAVEITFKDLKEVINEADPGTLARAQFAITNGRAILTYLSWNRISFGGLSDEEYTRGQWFRSRECPD